jgi:uncharacterized protein (TIGR02266 family)
MDKEKRRAWRSTLVLEVKYEGAGVRAETRISDISATGVFIDTMNPLAVGSRIVLSFKLPGGHMVEAEGVVTQSQPGIGMGVEYVKISPDDVRRIRENIHP